MKYFNKERKKNALKEEIVLCKKNSNQRSSSRPPQPNQLVFFFRETPAAPCTPSTATTATATRSASSPSAPPSAAASAPPTVSQTSSHSGIGSRKTPAFKKRGDWFQMSVFKNYTFCICRSVTSDPYLPLCFKVSHLFFY